MVRKIHIEAAPSIYKSPSKTPELIHQIKQTQTRPATKTGPALFI
jgi:hypothetical protein